MTASSTESLIIRNAQLEAFRQQLREDLRRRLLSHLRGVARTHAPELDDDGLHALIERGWTQAKRFRLEREVDLASYLEIVVALPPVVRDAELPIAMRQLLLSWGTDTVDKLNRFREWARLQAEAASEAATASTSHAAQAER